MKLNNEDVVFLIRLVNAHIDGDSLELPGNEKAFREYQVGVVLKLRELRLEEEDS